jgi:hypothetical protein
MKKLLLVCFALIAIAAGAQTKGKIDVYDFGSFKLHIYHNNDTMNDQSFIFEGKTGLIDMELPLFKDNMAEFQAYEKKLNKPVIKSITDYHLGGTADEDIIMPEGMPTFIKGDIYGGMMNGFQKRYGDSMVSLPTGKTVEVPFGSTETWDGIKFQFLKGVSGDFPAATIIVNKKVYYTHMAFSKAHMTQINSVAEIDTKIAETKSALKTGCELFAGNHGSEVKKDVVEFRLAYLKNMKKLVAQNKTADAFVAAMKSAYPGLDGEKGLDNLAKNLYK